MKNEKLLRAIGKIDDKLIHDAVKDTRKKKRPVWVKWVAAACFCLILGGLFLMQNAEPVPPVVYESPVPSPITRGGPVESTDSTPPVTPVETGEKINVYKVSSVGISSELIDEMQRGLKAAGWSDMQCTLSEDYGFILKGSSPNESNDLNSDECLELAKSFMSDSGLGAFLERMYLPYEFITAEADDLTVTYCYLTFDGERTGSYIRFIFEDNKSIGEVQAYLYASECIDTLPLLTLEEALVNAKQMDADGSLAAVDVSDYSIQNEKLVYVNGLPYYRFNGYGTNVRGMVDGYALAVDITASEISEQLAQQHSAFKLK